MKMRASVSSEPFRQLVAALIDGGFVAHANCLEEVLDGTWTTSSELIGELGLVVLAIRKECRPLNPRQKALVKQSLKEVRKAFPGFGWFSGLAFWR
ncbi:hypothetical protein [Methylomonas sp. HYX-M1]|uniref:hypothetical protein n=1 Tax=Methylomonas sp. HYX-M1 TaxID=3139307 RepID=UPI00345B992C